MSRSLVSKNTVLAVALGLALHGTAVAQQHHDHATSEVTPADHEHRAAPPVDDHAAMDHAESAHVETVHDTMDHSAHRHAPESSVDAPDHSDGAHGEMDHAAMGHDKPASRAEPITPIPIVTDADRAAAFPVLTQHMQHASEINHYVALDQLEGWDASPGSGMAWAVSGWVGSDLNRLWVRSDGERVAGKTEVADVELLYGRSITPWWDVVVGVKHDFHPGDSQSWAGFGLQGLAPYQFDVEATAYVSKSGQTAATLEIEYDLLFTNRLILQPVVELQAFGKDDPVRAIGSGVSTFKAGLRLRYEFHRKFAPYIGVSHERAFGDTATFREARGDGARDTRIVAGVRLWF